MSQRKLQNRNCSAGPFIVSLIRGYQLLISPILGARCRFYPSCSNYAIASIEQDGAIKGGFSAAKRICKCHPLNHGGYDPIILRKKS